MIDVGIDIGKSCHLVALAGEAAEDTSAVSPEVFPVDNTPAGRAGLLARLAAAGFGAGDTGCRIALEQVGGWASPLDQQLLAAGHQLVTIHPLRLSRARDLFGQPHKTDQRDALVLLSLLQYSRRGLVSADQAKQLRPVIGLTPPLQQLKALSRHYHQLSGQNQQLANRLGQLVSVWLPSLKRVFLQPTSLGCLGFLSQSSCPSQWQSLPTATIVSWFRRATASRRIRFEQARRVKTFALAGDWEKLPAGINIQIKHLAEMLLVMAHLKQETKTQLQALIADLPEGRALMTLPGCGLILGATILAELSPIARFKSHHQVAMYVGLTRLRYESGQSRTSRRVRLVNRRAKWAFRQLALINRRYCPLSQAYVARHLDRGKTPRRAKLALGRQLVKVAMALLKTGQPFHPDRL
jgi:transposase